MGTSILGTVMIALGGGLLGAAGGWIVHAILTKKRVDQMATAAQAQLNDLAAQRDIFAKKHSRSRAKLESLEATDARRSAETQSLLKKSKILAKNVLTLRTERENTKIKLGKLQNALGSLRQRTGALQTEFEKTQEFYKRELIKSLEKRKLLEKEAKDARAEQESFAELVESATLEHGSEENMVVAAQLRLGQLQVLERNVNKLEAENEDLNRDVVQLKKDAEARERDLSELRELRIHNEQLVRAVEALEGSRKEHETDAERYRQQADESEKQSDTLRLKLADLEENFVAIEKQQDQVLEDARNAAVVPILRKQS
ncbi:MAG: hypothetical protein ACR2QT_08265 [Woeseiaceae bacterium]